MLKNLLLLFTVTLLINSCSLNQPTQPEVAIDTFVPPAPPPTGKGIQLILGPFDIEKYNEREVYMFKNLVNTDSLFLDSISIVMKGFSHHFILYKYTGSDVSENVLRDLYTNGILNIPEAQRTLNRKFVFGAQTPSAYFKLPNNVTLPLKPNFGMDLNSHFVNATGGKMSGQVWVNLYTRPKIGSSKVAIPIFHNNTSFVLPAQKITTISGTYLFPEKINLFNLTSHAHKRNTNFKIYLKGGSRDGELVYESKDWHNPPLVSFDPPLVVEAGQGYRYEAIYNNETSGTKSFGLTSEDEMCIVIGYYFQ
ncbi:MAG: hypothetical protein EXR24_04240 [Ignavibacteria bacterium]|nr:hypothetical protein [Bacteroidota bacterium]MSQ46169.1 hypothetical protein [Ignavibacteria bacterium]